MGPAILLTVYCVLVVGSSLLGGWLPSRVRLTHTRLQMMMSLVAGLMLGVALLHMIPHATAYTGSLDRTVLWVLGGLLTMFFLLRALHFHSHDVPGETAHDGHAAHRFSWAGVAVGLGLHTAIDGIALAASVVIEMEGDVPLAGFGTFLVVALHKPMDALSITSIMSAGGWSPRARMLVNAGFASMCPLGAALFLLGARGEPGVAVGCALAFSAGVFLCIALGDLLPEVHFHSHDRLKLSAALLVGIALAFGIGLLEGHDHHGHDSHRESAPDRHDPHEGHDHD